MLLLRVLRVLHPTGIDAPIGMLSRSCREGNVGSFLSSRAFQYQSKLVS